MIKEIAEVLRKTASEIKGIIDNYGGMTGANYAKRLLETPYTRLFSSAPGAKLQNLDVKMKYGLEFIGNILTAVAEKKLPENTPVLKMIKETVVDTWPEISKRMINGSEKYKANEAKLPSLNDILQIFDELGENEMTVILDMLHKLEPRQRKAVIEKLLLSKPGTLKRISGTTPENRDKLAEILSPGPGLTEKLSDKVDANINALGKYLKRKLDQLESEKEETKK